MPEDHHGDKISGLILRVSLRDRRAFDSLYHATAPKLFGTCLRILRDRAEAEEAVRHRGIADLAGRAEAAEAALLRHRDGADVVLSALALGLGGLGLHRLLTEAADTPEDGERALALLLGTVSLRQQRAQAQALGVPTGPDVQRHRTDPL